MVDRVAALERQLEEAEARADEALHGHDLTWLYATPKTEYVPTAEQRALMERIAEAEAEVWRARDALEKALEPGPLL